MSRVLKMGLMVMAVLAMVVTSANAGGFFEGFEAYAVGSSLQDQGGWKGWGNDSAAAADAIVSDAVAAFGTKSVEISAAADLVHEFDVTGGKWVARSMQYVPGDATSGTTFFILMNEYNDAGPNDWSPQVMFNLENNTVRTAGDAIENVDLVRDAWVEIRVEVDLDNNLSDVYYNDTLLSSGAWGTNPSIAAIDLFANGAAPVYYDNIVVAAVVPEPATLTLLVMAGLGLLVIARRR